MVGLVDGSLSTLAPIFSIALATHNTRYAFIAWLATALGAVVSMAFSEGLSDTGELTGRGSPLVRGSITGGGTFVGGILHSLPLPDPALRRCAVARHRGRRVRAADPRVLPLPVLPGHLHPGSWPRHLRGGIIIAAISAGLGSLLGSPAGG